MRCEDCRDLLYFFRSDFASTLRLDDVQPLSSQGWRAQVEDWLEMIRLVEEGWVFEEVENYFYEKRKKKGDDE